MHAELQLDAPFLLHGQRRAFLIPRQFVPVALTLSRAFVATTRAVLTTSLSAAALATIICMAATPAMIIFMAADLAKILFPITTPLLRRVTKLNLMFPLTVATNSTHVSIARVLFHLVRMTLAHRHNLGPRPSPDNTHGHRRGFHLVIITPRFRRPGRMPIRIRIIPVVPPSLNGLALVRRTRPILPAE